MVFQVCSHHIQQALLSGFLGDLFCVIFTYISWAFPPADSFPFSRQINVHPNKHSPYSAEQYLFGDLCGCNNSCLCHIHVSLLRWYFLRMGRSHRIIIFCVFIKISTLCFLQWLNILFKCLSLFWLNKSWTCLKKSPNPMLTNEFPRYPYAFPSSELI